MKFEKLNNKLFDGDGSELGNVVLGYILDNTLVKFKIQDLVEFSQLEVLLRQADSLYIQSVLNFDVIEFDGAKIFHGRNNVLGLYGCILVLDSVRYIFIFSFGEYQPARFQVFLEGYYLFR